MSNTARTDTRLKKGLIKNKNWNDFWNEKNINIIGHIEDNKLKKKSDETTRLSPTQSDLEEKVAFKVINGEDIQSLAIKEDDLKKVSQFDWIKSNLIN